MSETISRLSSTHLLVRKAGGKFHVISFEQVISRTEKQKKLRTGDEISWKSKNRNERGRGEIIEMGKFHEKLILIIKLYHRLFCCIFV